MIEVASVAAKSIKKTNWEMKGGKAIRKVRLGIKWAEDECREKD